jgi:hypothetical protein
MPVWGSEFARVVQVPAVDGKHIRNIGEASQGVPHRAGRKREMSVYNIVMLSLQQLLSRSDSHRDISQHRKEGGRGLLPPEKDGYADYSYPFFNALGGQAKALRSQNGDLVALG